ncbi:MAG TPA: sialidase family protein [Vicinamibacterales bacterium]|nr:sialidase family protein [Vicinamibacterales bacterium]
MKSWHWSAVIVLIGSVVISASRSRAQSSSVTALASPAGEGSAQPQLTVSSRGVLLSWIERAGDLATLKFSERTAQGWTVARTASSGRDWFVNWADVPSVLRLADGSLYAHWLQKSGSDTYAYDVRLARSTDDGKTWTPSFTPHNDRTRTEHGFASLFQMPNAGLGLVWLDGRAMHSGGGEHGGGDMSVRAAVYDTKAAQISEGPVDLRACECCPTAAAVTADGPIVAYRDRSDTEIRDIYVSRLVGGKWSDGAPVHRDNWQIAACPVNGPALSANGKGVALAWFTAKGDQGHAYLAFSSDSGKTFGTPVQLDDASALGRVDVVLLEDGSAAATWIEFADGKAQFRMRRISRSGERSPAVSVAGLAASRASGYPRMAAFGSELVFAWTDAGVASAVKTASLSMAKATRSR